LLSFAAVKFLRTEIKTKIYNPTREEKHFLSVEQAKIWEYFSMFVNEKTNHLPPDNIKLETSVKIDNRTSPTNIGLYLLSVWGAYVAELICKEEMEKRIKNTLETIENLPKYKGHLYNWVNTKTLEVISPWFVSSVDSGNFIASLSCLLPVTEGEIQERISKIIENTEWDFLYDSDKKLFYNGFSPEGTTKSHYDMLMSECRILSYLAISEGIVDAEHWKKLSRTSGKVKQKYGCLSYSGTAFEYFMPLLFHPIFENSLIDKSLSFCLSENKRFSRYFKIPFGVSESAFVKNGEIGYKAHGIHTLSVSETENSKTISPYSNYLFMQYDFVQAYKNYKRLKTFADGELGLYESIDFSENQPKPIKIYMSHHMGMSFLSLLNVLNEKALQKAFMKDEKHRAYEELLWEDAVFIKE
jgi:cyclic beta-1,2-glucan synthetase